MPPVVLEAMQSAAQGAGLVVPPHWSPGVLGNILAVSYVPTIIEVAVSLGILAYGMLAFTLGVKYLPIFQEEQ